MMPAIRISISNYEGSLKNQRDRFALIGIVDTYLEEQDWRSMIDGIILDPECLDDAKYIMSKCKKLGINVSITM